MRRRRASIRRAWYRFSRNRLAVFGLALVLAIVALALFAPWVTPYPRHAGPFVDFAHRTRPPSATYWFGTDLEGRDIFTRIIFAYRVSLGLSLAVLVVAVPFGLLTGLLAGYAGGWLEAVIMRIVDIFLSIPSLVFALVVLALVPPTLANAIVAVACMWWPWYTRLAYNLTRFLRNEDYVTAAALLGASRSHILLKEILPNCVPSVMTKLTLDMGFVILLFAGLGFVGLGVQAPTPELGSMVAEGANYLPQLWWMSVFAGLAILVAVLGFNLVGDGLRNVLGVEV